MVVDGSELKPSVPKNGVGFFIEYDMKLTYVINTSNMMIVGKYQQKYLAEQCADFLDKADRLKLENEMDKVLRGE